MQQAGKPEDIVLRPANEHIEEFVREVNKARAIHVRTIMEPGDARACEFAVPETRAARTCCRFLPSMTGSGVTDAEGNLTGRVTARRVIRALARHHNPVENTAA